ncbi:type II toxin-antitoxin system Phd/YefM family antitoxin [Citrobacter braakii]|uniref:type II toxin-antitoxin system Phd/YefM family antitoxin n=1 Tax=Citrobacter braakii TaxID=57706 RepID=UPI0037CAFE63
MNTLSANEAKIHFGDLLLKAQQAPIQINKNGKPVAVVISADAYQSIETLILHLLQSKAVKAMTVIKMGNLVDGNTFFDELAAGQYD